MFAYGLAKTATHGISMMAAQRKDLPKDSVVTTILPYFSKLINCRDVIDTPQNRAGMPDADHSTWADPNKLAQLL